MDSLHTIIVDVIVAHPEDDTLWEDGTILSHPNWNCFIVCLSGTSSVTGGPRFYDALKALKADGVMGNLTKKATSGLAQGNTLEHAVLSLHPDRQYELAISHNPRGDYTKHLRNEEISQAVKTLWTVSQLSAKELCQSVVDDSRSSPSSELKDYKEIQNYAQPRRSKQSRTIIGTVNGEKESWNAETIPKREAFWQFTHPQDVMPIRQSHCA